MASVTIDDPPKMNILGLILGSILERNLGNPKRVAMLAKLNGDVVVGCGDMAITVEFKGRDGVRIRRGRADRPKARLEGRMDVLTDLTLGRGVLGHFFGRRIKLGGNILMLLRTWQLLKIDSRAPLLLETDS